MLQSRAHSYNETSVLSCRLRGCCEHNLRVAKCGAGGSFVHMSDTEVSSALKSGANVETLCTLKALKSKFVRNGHYGVQAQPKATVNLLQGCEFSLNKRGDTSGTGIWRSD